MADERVTHHKHELDVIYNIIMYQAKPYIIIDLIAISYKK